MPTGYRDNLNHSEIKNIFLHMIYSTIQTAIPLILAAVLYTEEIEGVRLYNLVFFVSIISFVIATLIKLADLLVMLIRTMNFKIMEKSIASKGYYFKYAAKRLKKKFELALLAVSRTGETLRYTGKLLHSNEELVKKAVSNYGLSLKYADPLLKKNKEIVNEAVKNNGEALEYADDEFKKDRNVALAAAT